MAEGLTSVEAHLRWVLWIAGVGAALLVVRSRLSAGAVVEPRLVALVGLVCEKLLGDCWSHNEVLRTGSPQRPRSLKLLLGRWTCNCWLRSRVETGQPCWLYPGAGYR